MPPFGPVWVATQGFVLDLEFEFKRSLPAFPKLNQSFPPLFQKRYEVITSPADNPFR